MAVTAATRATPGLDYGVPVQEPIQTLAADGAITIPSGQVWITKGSAAALTLADPTADGLRLKVTATTAHAHVLDLVTGVDGGAADEGTFGGAAYDHVELVSKSGAWYVASKLNVTFA